MLGRLQSARRKVIRGKTPYRAVLGNENDNVYAEAGYYWVRPYDAANINNIATPGAAYRVRAGSALVVPRAGFVVWVGYGLDNHLTVLGYDHNDLILKGINPTSIQPNDPYRSWIRLKDIQNFRALPISVGSGMLVQVRQLFYFTATGDLVRWNGTNADTQIDLTAYVPASGWQRYVILWLRAYNPNGLSDIQVTYSTPISSIDGVLSFSDLQECADQADADAVPIQAFRLANAQTLLTIDDTIDVDLRPFINMPQVYGFPNTVSRAYRVHEGFSVVAPSAITVEGGGLVQIQDNALLVILSDSLGNSATDNGMTQLTGDVLAGPGSGAQVATLATVNTNAGTFAYPSSMTANEKGLITAITAGSAPAPADAHYLTTQAESGLSNEVNLGALTTGLLKHAVSAGVSTPATATAGTDYLSPSGTEAASNKAITASTIDSTPIGGTTQAAGYFSALRVYIGGSYANIVHTFTGNRVVTLPGDANVTLVGLDTVQVLTGKTIDGDDNTLQDIPLAAIKTVGANTKRFITRDASGVISDATNPVLDNLQHTHANAAGGGNITGTAFGTQAINTILAGPSSGSAATPTFRTLVKDDVPWATPGAIGSTTPDTGAFVSITTTGDVRIGPAGAALSAARLVVNAAASSKGLIVQANATGAANVVEAQSSSAAPLWWVTPTGHMSLNSALSGEIRWTNPSTSTVANQFYHDGSNFVMFNNIGQMQFRNQANAETSLFTNGVARIRVGASGLVSIANTSVSAASQLDVSNTDTGTNAVLTLVTTRHNTSATPVPGYGSAIVNTLQSSTTANRSASIIKTLWNVATDTGAIPDVVVSAYYNPSGVPVEREGFRVRGGASGVQSSVNGVTPVTPPTWGAPTGTLARTTFDPSTATLLDVAQRLAALITDTRAYGMLA